MIAMTGCTSLEIFDAGEMNGKSGFAVCIDLRENVGYTNICCFDLLGVCLKDVGGIFYFADVIFHFFEDFGDFACVVGENVEGFFVDIGDLA
jgi:hypothetical protein